MKIRIAALVVAAGWCVAAQAASDRVASFRVGTVAYTVPMPQGYCLPTGKMATLTDIVASTDKENNTSLTLVGCGAEPIVGANDYTVIKSPRSAVSTVIDRPTLLAAVGKEFEKPFDINPSLTSAGDSVSNVIGTKVDIGGTFAPRGKDDVCAYLAGVLHYETANANYDQPMGGCITSVGGRILYIYRTGLKTDTASVLKLLRETRAIALSIKVVKQ